MQESLIGRVGRIISANVNALIDAIETSSPETVMQEAIREIDSAIDDVRAELGVIITQKHLASSRLAENNKKHDDLAEKINLAIAQARDDLAETAVAKQIDIEAQQPVLEATINDCGLREKEIEGYITALLAKKREMIEALELFTKTGENAGAPSSMASSAGTPSRLDTERKVEKATSAFDRVMEKSAGVGGVDDRKTAAQLAELEEMARKNRIQERLAQIKGKVNG